MKGYDKVLGFQFEPERSTPTEPDYIDDSEEEVSSRIQINENVADWCSCGNCKKNAHSYRMCFLLSRSRRYSNLSVKW